MDVLRGESDLTRRAFVASSVLLASGLMLHPAQAFADVAKNADFQELEKYLTADGVYDFSGLQRTEIDRLLLLQAEYEASCVIAAAEKGGLGGIVPHVRPSYSNVYGSPVKASTSLATIKGVPSGGVSFNTYSFVSVALTGGVNVTLSFSFPSPWGSTGIGVSLPLYKGVGAATGYGVGIPGDGKRYTVKAKMEYESTPYTVYYTNSSGEKSVYKRMHTVPSIVGHDIRAVLA